MRIIFGLLFCILFLGVSAGALLGFLQNASFKWKIATLEDGLAEAERQNDELTRRLQQIAIDADRILKEHAGLEERGAQFLEIKEELAGRLNEFKEARQTLNNKVERLISELAEVTKDMARIENAFRSISARQLSPEEVELRGIVVKPERSGKVIEKNDKYNFVVINLGKEDGIKKGMVFGVYQGSCQRIGSVKVFEVREHVTAARVEQEGLIRGKMIRENDVVMLEE